MLGSSRPLNLNVSAIVCTIFSYYLYKRIINLLFYHLLPMTSHSTSVCPLPPEIAKTIQMYCKDDDISTLLEYLSAIAYYEYSVRSSSLLHRKNSCFGFGYSFGVNGKALKQSHCCMTVFVVPLYVFVYYCTFFTVVVSIYLF